MKKKGLRIRIKMANADFTMNKDWKMLGKYVYIVMEIWDHEASPILSPLRT